MKSFEKDLPLIESFKDKNIKVFALGGLGEVGKNMYCVECDDELIVIDSGILFPDNAFGVDYIIPDYTYLINNESKIKGLFITHGHEDHIGGIPYLLKKVKIPAIYATGLAVGLIKNKLAEHNNIKVTIQEFTPESIYFYKNFEISFFRTNHSIPDSFGIAIKTRLGYILHTGDFKFDYTPLGKQTDYHKLTAFGEKGVLCLLADSTNANVSSLSSSEKKISGSIKSIFQNIKGRVIISTFASNVYRVQQIVQASVECGRKVIVFGRSMEKTINVGKQLNYIKAPEGTFIGSRDFPHIDPSKITILSTGSQGEPLAALSRIADGTHKTIKIIPGDTIVFSSSAIPGNQEGINRTINKLYRAGANVIVNSPLTDTHTSGHASEEELKLMLVLTKPKYFMPIHGEYAMLYKHKQLAISTGVNKENCFVLENGQVLTFTEKGAFSNYSVKSGNGYIDGSVSEVDLSIIRERRTLSDDGVVSVIYTVNKKHKLIAQPTVCSRGFIYMKTNEDIADAIKLISVDIFNGYVRRNDRFNENHLKTAVINSLNEFIFERTERKPMIIPIVITI